LPHANRILIMDNNMVRVLNKGNRIRFCPYVASRKQYYHSVISNERQF
jgi:hypothetical protein